MFERQRTGSVLCAACGQLVGVNDKQCFHCGRYNPSMWGFGGIIRSLVHDFGFVKALISGSVALFIVSLALDPAGVSSGGMMLFSPSWKALFLLGGTGFQSVVELGRWWTLLSAGWLHGGLLHLGFNMMWVRNLAPATADCYGPGRMVIIYTTACITGFLFSSFAQLLVPSIPILGGLLSWLGLAGGYRTIGASGAIFGLLGALMYNGRRTGQTAAYQQALTYAVVMGIIGVLMPQVDNQAHLGGFIGGYMVAKLLDPLQPERGDHLFIALFCIALSILSIVLSVWTGLQYFPP